MLTATPLTARPPVSFCSTGLARSTRPSPSISAAPVGSERHASSSISSARARARRWRSRSQKTLTFERSMLGSKGLRT